MRFETFILISAHSRAVYARVDWVIGYLAKWPKMNRKLRTDIYWRRN